MSSGQQREGWKWRIVRSWFRTPIIGLILWLAAGIIDVNAALITVTSNADSGPGTLRAAIASAASGDTINFAVTGTIQLASALSISQPVTIQGPASSALSIKGSGSDRVFVIAPAADFVLITGLTITGGNAALGGGILIQGGAAIFNCDITGNTATQRGGGIYRMTPASAIYRAIVSCTIEHNTAGIGGGGIYFPSGGAPGFVQRCSIKSNTANGPEGGGGISTNGTLTVTDSTFSSNTSVDNEPNPPGGGGGLCNQAGGQLTVIGSTFSSNVAQQGGGLYNLGATNATANGSVSIINCTFDSNHVAYQNSATGGGILNQGSLSLLNCTITNNTSDFSGGGFYQGDNASASSLRNCILALNTASINDPDGRAPAIQGDFNLIQNIQGMTFSPAATHNIVGQDPQINPLGNNGGPTLTVSLNSTSPAVDAGDDSAAPVEDQRSYSRFNKSDIGAYEFGGALGTTLANISTRANIQTGDNVLIGGFIITGGQPKPVLLRAIGPSLNVTGKLADPFLELHDSSGALIASNDNWRSAANSQDIINTGIPPTNDLESAILVTLNPGAYTVIMGGVNGGTGIGLVEAYDLDVTAGSRLANISTRGFVQTGDNVLIGGFIILGVDSDVVVVRAIGPSLTQLGVSNALADPTLELYDTNGTLIESSDNWRKSDPNVIIEAGLAPTNDAESALLVALAPGPYTAVMRGANNTTGVGLVEVYGGVF
jgi:hypothetical protein